MSNEVANSKRASSFLIALGRLRDEWKTSFRHRKGKRKAKRFRLDHNLKLHLGCGPNCKPGWLNIDLVDNADLSLDLRRPLPFNDDSCAVIYSEHFLEHLDYPECADSFLAECKRVLKSGGEFSVGVPDTTWPLLEYAGTRDDDYFELAKSAWQPRWCKTRLEHINYHFRQDGEHRFAYDYETLAEALKRAGFIEIKGRAFDPRLDSESRRVGTLYVSAIAP